MKNMVFYIFLLLASGNVLAEPLQCSFTALDAASYIDAIGWGAVKSEPLKVISGIKIDETEAFRVRSTVSGYTYTVTIEQDMRSESCVVISLTAGATYSHELQ